MKFELQQEPARRQTPLAEPDFARWRSTDGEVLTTFHRAAGGFIVRFIDRADFMIALDDGVVTCRPVPGTSSLAARDLYLNQVLPMIVGHQGELVVHASAVAIGGRVAAFVGSTGRGKSTLAAAFARAAMPFLSDDGLRLTAAGSGYLASPNRPSLRLWQDSEAAVVSRAAIPRESRDGKSRVEASEALPFQTKPLPMRALYFLGPGDSAQPGISDLSAPQALAELINHSFFLDVEDRERMKRHFHALARLVETVPSYALDYPRIYERLPSVIATVSSHMGNAGGSSEAVGQD